MGDTNGFIKGALIGGLVAGAAGLLLAPKPGSKLLQDIMETYDHAQKNGHDLVETIKKKGSCLTHCWDGEECENHSSLLIGGVIGAVIAGIAALMLAPDSGKQLRRLLGKQYTEIVGKAEDFVSNVGEKGKHVVDEVYEWEETLADLVSKLTRSAKSKVQHSSKINDILDLAHLGIRMYRQLQNRR